MFLEKIAASPKDGVFNVVIEIPSGQGEVKYEFDKESGAVFVDRFSKAPMHYPVNYGFIPNTLGGDGDPIDALVITTKPLITACVIPARPVGVLMMEDESGEDEKIIMVPTTKIDANFENIADIGDVSDFLKNQITHFFEHYKKLDKNKWVKIKGFEGKEKSLKIIEDAIQAHK